MSRGAGQLQLQVRIGDCAARMAARVETDRARLRLLADQLEEVHRERRRVAAWLLGSESDPVVQGIREELKTSLEALREEARELAVKSVAKLEEAEKVGSFFLFLLSSTLPGL